MLKHKNLVILIVLIIVWSLFFAIYKYFMWWVFKTDTITLQYISGYLSMGTIGAFIIGWLLYELFREKKYHLATIWFTLITILSVYFLKKANIGNDALMVGIVTLVAWFFYWLWWVLRNILISTQIHESGLSDTKVNGIANIAFITSIIFWSIIGGIIAEKMNIYWVFVIGGILAIGLICWLQLTLKKEEMNISTKQRALTYKKTFLADFVFIVKKYFLIMLFVSLIITIATIMSQKAIEYSVANLGKTGSQAAMILLYSAVGSIIGNLISMKIRKFKRYIFLLLSLLFAATINMFPTFLPNFLYTSIAAFIAWIFFGTTYNLLEATFFKMIAEDDKKSYGAATLGIITSGVISFMMFFIDGVQKVAGYDWVYQLMGCIILTIGIIVYQIEGKLD